jgi:hypothetical protein
MTLKSQMADRVANAVDVIERRAGDLSGDLAARVDDARDAVGDWAGKARRLVRGNPVAAVAGAFALGFGLASLASLTRRGSSRRS